MCTRLRSDRNLGACFTADDAAGTHRAAGANLAARANDAASANDAARAYGATDSHGTADADSTRSADDGTGTIADPDRANAAVGCGASDSFGEPQLHGAAGRRRADGDGPYFIERRERRVAHRRLRREYAENRHRTLRNDLDGTTAAVFYES